MQWWEYTLIFLLNFSLCWMISLYFWKPMFKKLYGYKWDFIWPLFLYLGLIVVLLLPDRKKVIEEHGMKVTVNSFDIFIKDKNDNYLTIKSALKNTK